MIDHLEEKQNQRNRTFSSFQVNLRSTGRSLSIVSLTADRGADEDIDLVRGGIILLRQGAVTSFVPNPDHIHVTGVSTERSRAVSLHLYGRTMSNFNIYDVDARTRRRIAVAHNES